ncbi:fungal-specific transcription factor domain-containing protein [Crucibulum laeve]|uniref:Fungal-specific transcription factor domain-containing protein n=1 Tax=Crucibulum laeve TaxID=68775 RepID=A0A5C3M1W3_9AGAR|nr:fungal-specific transcription factor domain-containing protein [Crucibulum laeve]
MASPSNFSHRDETSSLVNRTVKRRGVALSCAECRRLKLKCSRVFPCSNCVKKGCGAICPDGSLTTGKGNRFVLANTEALHDKISTLANRVRQLEDALLVSHTDNPHSRHPHPLLSDELLQIKRPLERERQDAPPVKDENAESGDAIDAMGSLSISQGGRSTFFGQTANSWYLLQNEEGSDEEDDSSPVHEPPMPLDVPWLSFAFPFTSAVSKTAEGVRGSIISLLPGVSTAKKICDIYYRHAAWMYTPISELDFYETIFRPVYTQDVQHESVNPHRLAVLLMVLALGTLLDLEKPAHNPEAMQYYQLARAALALDSVLEEQSISGIQALLLMCHFMFLSDMGGPRWVVMGMVVKLAHSIGLHRDSGKWHLNAEETYKRRELFYELLTYDSWQSLTYGRPPSLSSAHIDTKFPVETTTNAAGELEMSFAAWKHRFSAQCLSVVHDQAFGTRTPNYKVIQELDRKVRQWYIPPSLQVPGFGGAKVGAEIEQPSIELTMQRYIAFAIKEITLFYMHRGFFAQALEDNAQDPMGSKYAPSVLAAYTSACSFVGLIESLFKQHPAITERMWFLFTHVFSCAIVLGSIAVKSRMALAPSALSHLESAYHLFTRVSDNTRTGKILPILQKLKERAHSAQSGLHQASSQETATRLSYFGPTIKSEDRDELSALGGMTRLVSRKSPSSPPYSASSPPSQPTSPIPLSQEPPQSYQAAMESASTAWQNYTHIQNFNVNINVNEFSGYPNVNTPVQPQASDMSYMYNNNTQVHAQQMLPMDPMQEYYGYPSAGYAPMQMMPSPDGNTPPHDVQDSWQNFMAQYKPM